MEQKAGQVNWQDVNSLVRPGVIRLFTYQLISRGASGVLYYRWRQPRIGNEKFYGAVLPHHLEGNNRVFKEISQIGEELKLLAPALKDTKVVAEACILYTPRQRLDAATADASRTNFSTCASTSNSSTTRCTTATSPWILRGRPRTCRNTRSFSRRRCTCWPPARPTG